MSRLLCASMESPSTRPFTCGSIGTGINVGCNGLSRLYPLVSPSSSPGVRGEAILVGGCLLPTFPSRFTTRDLPVRLASGAMVESVPSVLSVLRSFRSDPHLRRPCHVLHQRWWFGGPECPRAAPVSMVSKISSKSAPS